MSAARDEILGRIRAAVGTLQPPQDQRAEAQRRLSRPVPNLVPERGRGSDKVGQFISEVERVDGTTARVSTFSAVPGAIAAYLAENNLPRTVKAAPDPLLKNLPWGKAESQNDDLAVAFGRAEAVDPVGLSMAFAGVAETGTLVLVSGAEAPVTVNFLPDTHIVVLPAAHLAGAYEDVWARLRRLGDENGAFMPRTVNWITGPSRTADIEQSLLLGAHGPRRLHVIVVDGDD